MTILKKITFLSFLLSLPLIYWLATQHVFFIPLSSKKTTLCPTTISLIQSLNEPIKLILYTRNSDLYRESNLLIEQYQHLTSFIEFKWEKNPYTFSDSHLNDALVLQTRSQKQHIDLSQESINEKSLSQLFFKIMRNNDSWILFVQGHGEPDIFGKDNQGYYLWKVALNNQGLKIHPLILSNTKVIADNAQLIVLSRSLSTWLPYEEKLITDYLEKGGHLLWLMDPFSKKLPFLEKILGIAPLPGTIVDLHGQQLGTSHPAITLIEQYPALPFSAPTLLSIYPWSVALHATSACAWQVRPLLVTHEATWTETQPLVGNVEFNPHTEEKRGPLLLGLILTRPHPTLPYQEQRIAVIGNSRFMSNNAIQHYGNLAFGQNLISWLHHDDHLLTLEQPLARDTFSHVHLYTAYLIQFGFPGLSLFLGSGIILYSIRRRHYFKKN